MDKETEEQNLKNISSIFESSGLFEGGIPDDPGVAFIEALDLMTRTMLEHPDYTSVVAALDQDERDELIAGTPIFQATAWMDLIQKMLSTEVSDGNRGVDLPVD